MIVEPVGYEAIYVSGTTTSNFLYWLRQYTFGQRPDVELYNINDERFDIDKLAGLLWRSLGARPVFVDYFFLNQTHQRRGFSEQGRPAGFILELTDGPTGPEEAWPLDAEVLARAEEALRATDFAPDRPTHGAELAVSVWQYHGTFHEYRGEPERAGYYFQHDVEVAPNCPTSTWRGGTTTGASTRCRGRRRGGRWRRGAVPSCGTWPTPTWRWRTRRRGTWPRRSTTRGGRSRSSRTTARRTAS
jgi:hypothetical protein